MPDPYRLTSLQDLPPQGLYAEEQALFAEMKETLQKRKRRLRWQRRRLALAVWIAGRGRQMAKGRPEGRPDLVLK